MKYVPPSTGESAFTCPHCKALAHQRWGMAYLAQPENYLPAQEKYAELQRMASAGMGRGFDPELFQLISLNRMFLYSFPPREAPDRLRNLNVSECFNCKEYSIWVSDTLVYPAIEIEHVPNADLPDDIAADYREASVIFQASPRGAAALLRLCVQKLCKHLGKPGKNINDDIRSLVSDGLTASIQQALDTVRVIGNEAVHPGKIDLQDDRSTAASLFGLVNFIADKMISEPKHVAEIYGKLPPSKVAEIDRRDGKAKD